MLRSAESNADALLRNVSTISLGMLRLANAMKDELEHLTEEQWKAYSARDKTLMLHRYANVVQKGIDAARDIIELRKHLLGAAATRAEAARGADAAEERQDAQDDAVAEALAELRAPGGAHRLRRQRRRGG